MSYESSIIQSPTTCLHLKHAYYSTISDYLPTVSKYNNIAQYHDIRRNRAPAAPLLAAVALPSLTPSPTPTAQPKNQLQSHTGRRIPAQQPAAALTSRSTTRPTSARGRRAAACCTNRRMLRPPKELTTSRSMPPSRAQHRSSSQPPASHLNIVAAARTGDRALLQAPR